MGRILVANAKSVFGEVLGEDEKSFGAKERVCSKSKCRVNVLGL